VTSVPGGEINSGENSNSVGGVPINIRPRISGFSWLGCGLGLDSHLLLKLLIPCLRRSGTDQSRVLPTTHHRVSFSFKPSQPHKLAS
jgi:hypothetical protein